MRSRKFWNQKICNKKYHVDFSNIIYLSPNKIQFFTEKLDLYSDWYAFCKSSCAFNLQTLYQKGNMNMTHQVLDMNESLVAKILYDFDGQLQARFSSSLFQFILATDEISEGMFHETVRQVWHDAGPLGLRSYLKRELVLLEDSQSRTHKKLSS